MQNKISVNQLTPSQSLFLDLVRFIAAQIVLVAHLSEWLYRPFVKNNNSLSGFKFYLGYFLYESELMAAFAVAFFFVLSGFLISKSIYKSRFTTGFNLRDYILSRVARLLPTLLVAVILSLLVYYTLYSFSLFGLHDYNLPGVSANFPRNSAEIKISTTVATALFLNGMIGVPGINIGTMNINGPLWSLAHEFWFYICAGLFTCSFLSKKIWPIVVVAGFIVWQFSFSNFLWVIGFLVWILGAISAQIKFKRKHIYILVISSLLFLFFTLEMNHGSPISLFNRALCGLTAFLILNTGLVFFDKINFTSGFIKQGASYSFTLYAIHWPCIVLFVGCFGPQLSSWSLIFKAVIYSLLFIGINLAAFLISKWSEDTARWRKLIQGMITFKGSHDKN